MFLTIFHKLTSSDYKSFFGYYKPMYAIITKKLLLVY